MSNESKLRKNLILIFALTASAASIYMLPYLRSYYYDAFIEAFGLTYEQSGLAGSYFGFFGALSYLIGGVIADKVSFKVLIPGSLIVSGLLGFLLLTNPSYMTIAYIHGVWGITSLMTFWPALVKALRASGSESEQGRVFGIFEGGRGIVNASVLSFAAFLFGMFYVVDQKMSGIYPLIFLFSSLPIALGIMNIFLLRNVEVDSTDVAGGGINFKVLGSVVKNPYVWMMCLMIFASYTPVIGYSYFGSYANTSFNVSVLAAGILTISSQYIRPFASGGAGFLADRINSSKSMQLGFVVTIVGLVVLLLSQPGGSIIPVVIGSMIVFFGMFMTFAMNFAVMQEVDFPKEASGTIIGIACTIGYLPEVIFPWLGGRILDMHPDGSPDGYRLLFWIFIAVTVMGMAITQVWISKTKERRAEILAARKAANAEQAAA